MAPITTTTTTTNANRPRLSRSTMPRSSTILNPTIKRRRHIPPARATRRSRETKASMERLGAFCCARSALAGWPVVEPQRLQLWTKPWTMDPEAENEGYFFEPMAPEDIKENPLVLRSGNVLWDNESDCGEEESEQDQEFFDMLYDELTEDDARASGYYGQACLEVRAERDRELSGSPSVPDVDGPNDHIFTAHRILWQFAESDRLKFLNDRVSTLFHLEEDTIWRYPSDLQPPERIPWAALPTSTRPWYVYKSWVSSEGHPHQTLIVANPLPAGFHGEILPGESETILQAMIARYEDRRGHLWRQRVMPVLAVSTIGRFARVIQAHFDGRTVIFRASEHIDPEQVRARNGYELFARYLASRPVGDTRVFPAWRTEELDVEDGYEEWKEDYTNHWSWEQQLRWAGRRRC